MQRNRSTARISKKRSTSRRRAGLTSGPVHAEFRLNERGLWLLEIAPRSTGGLCGSVLTHAPGMTLEELILRHALGRALPAPRHRAACGVMMIPIPERGIFEGVSGLEAALAVKGITGVRMTAERGLPGVYFCAGAVCRQRRRFASQRTPAARIQAAPRGFLAHTPSQWARRDRMTRLTGIHSLQRLLMLARTPRAKIKTTIPEETKR